VLTFKLRIELFFQPALTRGIAVGETEHGLFLRCLFWRGVGLGLRVGQSGKSQQEKEACPIHPGHDIPLLRRVKQ
jgi:hypothetical protein